MEQNNKTAGSRLRLVITVFLALCMGGVIIYSLITSNDSWPTYISGIILTIVMISFNLKVTGYPKFVDWLLMIAAPPAVFVLTENYTHTMDQMWQGPVILNLVFFYILAFFLLFLTGRAWAAVTLMVLLAGAFGLANYFVQLFRSAPIFPWDIYSMGIAATVADNFSYTLNGRACLVLVLFLTVLGIIFKDRLKIKAGIPRFAAAAICFVLLGGFALYVQTDEAANRFKTDKTLFTPKVYYRNNGLFLSFLINIRYLNIDKPDGYTVQAAEEAAKAYLKPEDGADSVLDPSDPNIIVVMNEALSDLRILGDYETNVPVTPFMDSLTENTQKGWYYSSVKGGNTANTEFEFLTGSSLYWLPVGSVAYQQYLREPLPSLAGQLSDMGYTSVALHPYYASGWNRDKVYDLFGFDEKYFLDSFDDPEYIRSYVSDRATFDKIIERYEAKAEGERLFFFDVTMQNHGSYTKSFDNFTPDVEIIDGKGTYLAAAERYLSLCKITDEAFKEFVAYFENQEEPTIIIMFGDHQPADYAVSAVNQTDTSTLEGAQQQYKVPYILWANYDIEEKEGDVTSANYLALRVLEAAGIEKTGYQSFLTELQEAVPVITSNMTIDSEGTFHPRNDEAMDQILAPYSILQYNDLVDNEHRIETFFENIHN